MSSLFNKIKPIAPDISTIGETLGLEKLSSKARDIMIGLGFHEVMTLILTNDRDQAELMNVDDYEFVELEGAKAIEVNIARKWIIPELMKTLRSNRHAAYPQLIFECGDVIFLDRKVETNARNERRLAALSAHSNSGFTEIKSIVETVLRQQSTAFREVVLLEYPRRGLWTIGFITAPAADEIHRLLSSEMANVFVPTTLVSARCR